MTIPDGVSPAALSMLDMVCMPGHVQHVGPLGHDCVFTQLVRAGLATSWTVSGHGTWHCRINIRPTAEGRTLWEARKAERVAQKASV